jgi:hypothetical protein
MLAFVPAPEILGNFSRPIDVRSQRARHLVEVGKSVPMTLVSSASQPFQPYKRVPLRFWVVMFVPSRLIRGGYGGNLSLL